MTLYLIDTDVAIDYLKNHPLAVTLLEELPHTAWMSVITVAELEAGIRNSDEQHRLDQFISTFSIASIDRDIAKQAGAYKKHYYKSHNVGLADAIIAATATALDATLLTLNIKHFPMLKPLKSAYLKH